MSTPRSGMLKASLESLAILFSILAGLAVLTLGNTRSLPVFISAGLLGVYSLAVLRTIRCEGSAFTPVTAFFTFAVIHAILGYYSLAPVTAYLLRPHSGINGVFEYSFLIVSVGLAAIMAGYVFFRAFDAPAWQQRLLSRLQDINLSVLNRRARILAVIAIPTLAYVFWQFGEIPLFAQNLARDRYHYLFRAEFLGWASLFNRCREIFQVTTPLLALSLFQGQRKFRDAFLLLLVVTSMVMMVQRGPLISILFTLAVIKLRSRQWKLLIGIMPLILVAYLGTHYFLFDWQKHLDWQGVLDLYGNALPEIRDLGWVLSSNPPMLCGSTFLQAVIPLPGFLTEFQRSTSLRTMTLDAVGIPLEAGHGGLRITLPGECYLNFGYPGLIVLCFLYGFICAIFSSALATLRSSRRDNGAADFVISSLWVLFSFWPYLAGTAVAGVIKFELIILLLLCFKRKILSRNPERAFAAASCT